MKRIFAISILVFSSLQTAFGQLDDDEIYNLRKHIKLSDTDMVKINERGGLSSDDTLKVYLAIDRKGKEKNTLKNG